MVPHTSTIAAEPYRSPVRRFGMAAVGLLVAGLGCGQFTAATTVVRDADGSHRGEWAVDMSLDKDVFAELQALSSEPADLDYRAQQFTDLGWDARATATGISAKRSFQSLDEFNAARNPLVTVLAGSDGEPPEQSPVHWTELTVDETSEGVAVYTYEAEVYVPEVDTDKLLDDVVLSLSQGKDVTITSAQTQHLRDVVEAAGPFQVQMLVTLPGKIAKGSIKPEGGMPDESTARWQLSEPGTYLLGATSRFTSTGDTETEPQSSGEAATAPDATGDAASGGAGPAAGGSGGAGGSGPSPGQKGAAVLLGLLGTYIAYTGLRGMVLGAAAGTALSPGLMVIVGVGAIAGGVMVWNYGPPPPPPNPVQVFIDAAQNNVTALERSSLRGLTTEEALELGFELQRLPPDKRQAVAAELGMPYESLIEALRDADAHPELFE